MIFPVPRLNGRNPVISDGFASVRENGVHGGIDIDYRALSGDPPFVSRSTIRTKNFFMPDGVPFLAIDDGIVRVAKFFNYGGGVTIEHTAGPLKGKTTFYAHGSKLFVEKGQTVKAGTPLGIIGHNPNGNPFNHLHVELWPQGQVSGRVDPEPHLERATKVDPPLGGADAVLIGASVVGSLLVGRWLATR